MSYAEYNIHSVVAGDLLRSQVRDQTELGKEAEAVMKAGGNISPLLNRLAPVTGPVGPTRLADCAHALRFAGLLPDETVLQLIAPGLLKLKNDNFILDGFPRKASQAQLLDALLGDKGLNLVVELAVPDSVILSRIEGEPAQSS